MEPSRRSESYRQKSFRLKTLKLSLSSFLNNFPSLKNAARLVWKKKKIWIYKVRTRRAICWGRLKGYYGKGFDPERVIWLDPRDVTYCSLFEFSSISYRGRVVPGNWDRQEKKFEDLDVFVGIKEACVEGKPWQETVFYQRILHKLERGQILWDCKDRSDFDKRCKDIEALFIRIKTEGYKSQGELSESEDLGSSLYTNSEIGVSIGRAGEFLFSDGAHRLAIAKILGLTRIPVKVVVRHPGWVKRRKELLRQKKLNKDGKFWTGQDLDHPDLAEISDSFVT